MSEQLSPRLEQVRQRLMSAAGQRAFVFYREVANLLGIRSDNLNHVPELARALDEISSHEHERGRPLLSVVVVHQDDKRPGIGFFKMARRNGVQNPDQDDETFFVAELERTWSYWQNAGKGSDRGGG